MVASFDYLEQMEVYFETVAEDVLRDEGSKKGVSIMKDILIRDLYSQPESDYYVRTGELLNSVVSVFNDGQSSKKKKIIEIKNATDENFMPSHHPNWFGEGRRNMNAWIPQYIDEGHGGLANFIGINYFQNTWDEFDLKITDALVKGFKKRGIDAYSV